MASRPSRVVPAAVGLVMLAGTAVGCASAAARPAQPVPFPTMTNPVRRSDAVRHTMAAAVAASALALTGMKYQLGGDRPATGFDCSGLVRYVFLGERVELPRTVAEQSEIGQRVGVDDISAGDLLFFTTTAPGPTHVGLAVDGRAFVHAPGSGRVVRVESLDTAYWSRRLIDVRRILD